MKKATFLLLFIGLILAAKLFAQSTIDGEIRPRAEYRSGFRKTLADSLSPAVITLQRSRINFDYKSKILNAHFTIQDSRVWGKSDTKSSDSKLEIYEAWAEYLITSGFSAQFGRQALKYDDGRLFSPAAWSNTGNTHDIMLFKFKPLTTLQIHAGYAYNNSKDTLFNIDYTVKKMYKEIGFLWVSNEFKNGLSVSGITVAEGFEKDGNGLAVYPRLTSGIYTNFQNDSSRLFFNAMVYYQKGRSSSFDTLNAFMLAFKAGYKYLKSNTVFIGTDYYSGSKPDLTKGNSQTFEKLYGANHSYNGYMEYFTSNPKGGLLNIYGGTTYWLSQKISASATIHIFNLAQKMIVNQLNIEKKLGSELDIICDYKISKEIALQAGYCFFFANDNTHDYFKMHQIETHTPQWAYLMLTIKPNFYKTPTETK